MPPRSRGCARAAHSAEALTSRPHPEERPLGRVSKDEAPKPVGPCFETLALLAPQHEVIVLQQVPPHPEEAAERPSRRMGRKIDM